MRTSDFHYDLPEEQIAQTPAEPRDSSRLLVYSRCDGAVQHEVFRDIRRYLRAGDVLVVNTSRVIPARLYGTKRGTDTEMEFLLLKRLTDCNWEAIMRPGRKLHPGETVDFSDTLHATLLRKGGDGVCEVKFTWEGVFEDELNKCGHTPLPPYIHDHTAPAERYQTVYAEQDGSAAAPTAGLHFTPQLLSELREIGVDIVPVILHVGLGTFRPVKEEAIEQHTMHEEVYEIPERTAQIVNEAKQQGRRVVAVGTTSVRALESAWNGTQVAATHGSTDIFIYPGSKATFHVVDALITNFHLPESTLLMLVAAFVGDTETTLNLYREAVEQGYRFFSFGDAMFIC